MIMVAGGAEDVGREAGFEAAEGIMRRNKCPNAHNARPRISQPVFERVNSTIRNSRIATWRKTPPGMHPKQLTIEPEAKPFTPTYQRRDKG